MINVSNYGINTPERCVAEYLKCLHKRAFTKMASHCQINYALKFKTNLVFGYSNLPTLLKNYFYKFDILNKYKILERKSIEEIDNTELMVDIIVEITYTHILNPKKNFKGTSPKKTITEKRLFRVIKEDSEGNPSVFGKWGVNPHSTLRGYNVKP